MPIRVSPMTKIIVLPSTLLFLLLFVACTTGHHGTFVSSTYADAENGLGSNRIGPVKGQSCQKMILYLIPTGPPPSTAEALQDAKNQYEDTRYLADISIDDRTQWRLGYSWQCIIVEGQAYR